MTRPSKPVPDGKIVVVLRHDTSLRVPTYGPPALDGQVSLTTGASTAAVREYGVSEAKWQAHFWGVEITRTKSHPDGFGKDLFPFTNVLTFSILSNSAAYEMKMLDYIRQCEHKWITLPQVPPLTYCEECRVDMSDLGTVMDPTTTSAPSLVVESNDLDRMSHAFDGKDPFARAEPPAAGPMLLVIDAGEIPDEVHRLVDEQLGDAGPAVDDPDTTEF